MKWDEHSGTGGRERVENAMDRTREENNSENGGERVENEMGLQLERRTILALEGREVGMEENGRGEQQWH